MVVTIEVTNGEKWQSLVIQNGSYIGDIGSYWLIMINMQWLRIVNNGEWMYDYGGSMVVNGGEIGS